MDQKDPQSLDNASRDFLDVLQSDERLAQARERERDQQRKRGGQAPIGPLVARPGGGAAAAPDAEPPLVAGQRGQRPAANAAPRLPTGVAQQPPSAGLARAPQPGGQTSGAGQQAAGAQGSGPLALVDARTLAALASGLAATPPAGRLVGPIVGAGATIPPPPGLGADPDKPALVGPLARPGPAPGQRPPPVTLSAVTPAEVRERIQMWMLTGVLNTTPLRFPAIDPLQPAEGPSARQGVTRATAVSPLARGVSARPSGPPPVTLAPANDVPGSLGPLAANDGAPSLGQAMLLDHARRGGAPGPLSPAAQPPRGTVPPPRATGGRDGRPDADRVARGGGSRPFDLARAERETPAGRMADTTAPTRLDIPGLGVPRV